MNLKNYHHSKETIESCLGFGIATIDEIKALSAEQLQVRYNDYFQKVKSLGKESEVSVRGAYNKGVTDIIH
ncbi:hypothetical protein A2130_04385 [Candidatus Woesebacteria bacterium GWC2_33_12]|uniref:Uncharacterized protein n=1 Tax=Candidatus Woesebacteria bacterium GW2011_GWB1_33_22 TaxID=1618566 RepID=A0A0F9ZZC5_9BACT|nr:MAG: hypothetical protein UR29_C0015G0029 [Candidatus Woesebacteria bacterium GW2011_GWC2_33_12]KKP41821.1 MAG: hypothetical protein UR33_C0009G0015 [Candidatus Woesebacteria bacterium GW2011_GWA2_33_20]KKP44321.1 MAG: hypothetical protein UR35_C0009G0032 [Candidatus Woesebacteria bacterium GW2011_GWB1_33_22]KKP46079.1 MAG: hypothetical protein UR37_C0012G0031 [Microgenomates group bacterium GW2011_GWC1_33_28]KKP49969.1 MAG: hypothetical protein UR41_C0011G0031 [Candidatus Woesebacteria bact